MESLLSYFPSHIREKWINQEKKTYKKGDFIRTPAGNNIFVLTDGVAQLFYINPDGKECVIDLFHSGDFIGVLAMFSPSNRTLYVRALTPISIIPLPISEVKDILLQSPELTFTFLEYVTKKFGRTLDVLEQVAYGKVEDRLLYLLERLAEEEQNGYRSLPSYLTHRDIAAMIGSTRETVTSLLNQFLLDGRLLEKNNQFWLKV
ncbi:MAG TPA: Crp/Fnr family transcriptional regulator [Bacillus bacterium]|nr:Crp/Fnr family transcriptional regulator [Bacillus sp. (in: firmicutes)]